jgi:hypothetical protein
MITTINSIIYELYMLICYYKHETIVRNEA